MNPVQHREEGRVLDAAADAVVDHAAGRALAPEVLGHRQGQRIALVVRLAAALVDAPHDAVGIFADRQRRQVLLADRRQQFRRQRPQAAADPRAAGRPPAAR
jgi:hypothetical protein